MTARDMLPPKGFLRERLWIFVAQAFFVTVTAMGSAIFTPLGDKIMFFWNLPDQMVTVEGRLGEIEKKVTRALGEDRVIRQRQGLSYVEEPVHVGENVNLILVLERTTLGANCRLVEWVPLFTDSSNIPTPGERVTGGPIRRQIGAEATKLRIEIIPPPMLLTGRVEVYLSMDYDCSGASVPERSDPVTYRLLPVEDVK